MIIKLLRLFHTVKYLKIKQVVWRAINLLPKFVRQIEMHPPISKDTNSNLYILRDGFTEDFKIFTFLNESFNLEEVGWDNPTISKLWRYNLHYFEFLLQDNISIKQRDLQYKTIENWIDNNQFGIGTGWEPYPTSLRIINWIKWHWSTGNLSERAKISLWNQVRLLESRPEYHLLGNHLFINAKALMYATVFFKQNANSSIYKKALKIIKQELDEQFLPDGAHFELSPMYHSLAMEDLLDLVSISEYLPNDFPKMKVVRKYEKGMVWLKTMIYFNEELAHFNDCANGIAPVFSQLEGYANKLGLFKLDSKLNSLNYHSDSGFVVYQDKKSHFIGDIGKIGPDYLPGHSHADTFSFELAIKGNRIIVNSGTSVYGDSKERLRQRGTSAHSTLQIDAEDSSEVWSGFRVARRAKPFDVRVDFEKEKRELAIFASHDGYLRLRNSPIHKRIFNFENDIWQIRDIISESGNQVVSRYFLHPDIHINMIESDFILSKNGQDIVRFIYNSQYEVEVFDSTYHDKFGSCRSNKCIEVRTISPCDFSIKLEIL